MRFDGSEPETCERCGFDSRQWDRAAASSVFKRLGSWWRQATEGISAEDLNRRPTPGTWSALEYGLHSAIVVPILRYAIEATLGNDGSRVHDPCHDVEIEDASHPLVLDPGALLVDLEREGSALSRLVDGASDGWGHLGKMDDGNWWQAEATLLHAAHDTTHHFMDVGEGFVRIGVASPAVEGPIVDVHSAGDCPRPFEAVWLDSGEGGAPAGQSLVVSGIDFGILRPGTRVAAGKSVLELSYPAESGWYAWIRRAGEIRVGDIASLSPE